MRRPEQGDSAIDVDHWDAVLNTTGSSLMKCPQCESTRIKDAEAEGYKECKDCGSEWKPGTPPPTTTTRRTR